MKIIFVSMRKYKMCLGWKYRLKHIIGFKKYFSGKVWQFRFMCEYGFDLDFRKGNIIDNLLTPEERRRFYLGGTLRHRKN